MFLPTKAKEVPMGKTLARTPRRSHVLQKVGDRKNGTREETRKIVPGPPFVILFWRGSSRIY